MMRSLISTLSFLFTDFTSTKRYYFCITMLRFRNRTSRKRWVEPNGAGMEGSGGCREEPVPVSSHVHMPTAIYWMDTHDTYTQIYNNTSHCEEHGGIYFPQEQHQSRIQVLLDILCIWVAETSPEISHCFPISF